jgi:glutaredoxin
MQVYVLNTNNYLKMGCQCSTFDKHSEAKIDLTEPFSEIIKSQINEYQVLLYSRSYCEQSRIAKQLLRKNLLQFEYFELDNMNDDGQAQSALQTFTGKKSTPYVFITGKYYGGLKELQQGVESGDFQKKIKENDNE